MIEIENMSNNYWFTVEPYVYIGLNECNALLYNTMDKETIESDKIEVVELLHELIKKENAGVVLLKNERYQNTNIRSFIHQLREKFMGDIIDVDLSNGKPIQLLPFFNFGEYEIYKKHNFSVDSNVFDKLYEICIYVDHTTNTNDLIGFLHSIPEGVAFNIIGDISRVEKYNELLYFFNCRLSRKILHCSYRYLKDIKLGNENNFLYKILVDFPLNVQCWNNSIGIILDLLIPYEYIFEVKSNKEYRKAEQLIKEFDIQKYSFKPIYTGRNVHFFMENVFLTKSDILAELLSIKDIFAHQAINIYDFGKINIMANGDAYANLHHPKLGNIYTHSINEIVYKEIEEGVSWFRIRNQPPCNNCVYQWLCPSPSDYELLIGRFNLCHVNDCSCNE